jgi:hypothetical protein
VAIIHEPPKARSAKKPAGSDPDPYRLSDKIMLAFGALPFRTCYQRRRRRDRAQSKAIGRIAGTWVARTSIEQANSTTKQYQRSSGRILAHRQFLGRVSAK